MKKRVLVSSSGFVRHRNILYSTCMHVWDHRQLDVSILTFYTADCWRHLKNFLTLVRMTQPVSISDRDAKRSMHHQRHVHANSNSAFFQTRKRLNVCVLRWGWKISFTCSRWRTTVNNRNKLNGQCTKVNSRTPPSIPLQTSFKNFSRAAFPLRYPREKHCQQIFTQLYNRVDRFLVLASLEMRARSGYPKPVICSHSWKQNKFWKY